ncbi:MAG: DNA mismatch repair protein MutS, partial [Prochlorococcaceae cyanobacterium]
MSAKAEQQLSLEQALGLSGSPAATAAPAEPVADEGALVADASSRPRQRQSTPTVPSGNTGVVPETASEPQDDLPPWHHHSLVKPAQLTPMLRHYVELKAEHPERVLLYRLGDFFECFFEDAILVSRLLELTLTGKEGGKAIGRVPMAGIPHHAA